jgi:hypothetical protein
MNIAECSQSDDYARTCRLETPADFPSHNNVGGRLTRL